MKDSRLSREEFETMRDAGKLAFGQVPALSVGSDILTQSSAILKFIGKQNDLYPVGNDVLAAKVPKLLRE